MTVFELGAIGEFIGAIAVLVTLIYLAMQIKQNTLSVDEARKATIAQSYIQISQLRVDAGAIVQGNEKLLELLTNLSPGNWVVEDFDKKYAELTEVDKQRFVNYQSAVLAPIVAATCETYLRGLSTDNELKNIRALITNFSPMWQKLNIRISAPIEKVMDGA